MVIHIQCKFHEIPFSGYLVMATDGWTEGRTKLYLSAFDWGIIGYSVMAKCMDF